MPQFRIALETLLFIPWLALAACAQHIVLQRDELKLELSRPGDSDNYQGTRFDRSGMFHKIEYKGHSLCERWHSGPQNPTANDDVTGPCEEFGNELPLGYLTNKPGSSFLKIGVGKLVQPEEEKYRFFYPYSIAEEAKWTVDRDDNSVVFSVSQQNGDHLGYSYRKQVSIVKDGFEIRHELTNTGSESWTTDHYNHNFFLIDSDHVGPNYEIDFAFNLKSKKEQALFLDLVRLDGRKMSFNRVLAKDESYFAELEGHHRTTEDHQFSIRHKPSGIVVSCRGDFPLYKLNVWGMKNTICPEPYVKLKLAPNEKVTWMLRYQFSIASSSK